jgi:hypothetical protein
MQAQLAPVADSPPTVQLTASATRFRDKKTRTASFKIPTQVTAVRRQREATSWNCSRAGRFPKKWTTAKIGTIAPSVWVHAGANIFQWTVDAGNTKKTARCSSFLHNKQQ